MLLAVTESNLATDVARAKEIIRATALLEECLTLYRQLGQADGLVEALVNRGLLTAKKKAA